MTRFQGAGDPIHPGEVLEAEFRAPHGLSRARLARATGLSEGRLARLTRDRGRLDAEAALLLGRVFAVLPPKSACVCRMAARPYSASSRPVP